MVGSLVALVSVLAMHGMTSKVGIGGAGIGMYVGSLWAGKPVGSSSIGVRRQVGGVLLASSDILATGQSGSGGRLAAVGEGEGDAGEAEEEGKLEVEHADDHGAQLVRTSMECVGWSGEVAAGAAGVLAGRQIVTLPGCSKGGVQTIDRLQCLW